MLKISEKSVENKEDVRRKKLCQMASCQSIYGKEDDAKIEKDLNLYPGSSITESRSKLSDLFVLFLAAWLFTEYRQFF